MTLFQFASFIDQCVVLTRLPDGRWSAALGEDASIEGSGGLGSAHQFGETQDMALMKLAAGISGKRLVFGAGTPERAVYRVPSGLEHKP